MATLKKRPVTIPQRRSGMSKNFVIALSVVSIIGFLNIITESLFNWTFVTYIESLWLLTLGIGLISETSRKELKAIKRKGLTSDMLGKITMIVVGAMAVAASILSLPQLDVQSPTFLAIKGIIGLLAVIFIIVQTWVTKNE